MVKRWAGALILFSAFLFVTNWGFDYLRSIDEPGIITIIPDALDVNEGDTVDLAVDSNLAPDRLNIISANYNVIRLENGRLVAQGPGSTYVTVESQDGRVQDQVLITVLSPNLEAPVDQSFTVILDGTALDYDGPVPVHALHTPAQEDFTFLGVSLKEDGAVLEPSTLLNNDTTLFSVFAAILEPVTEEADNDPLVEDPVETEAPIESEDETKDAVDEDSETLVDEEDEPDISTPSSITVTLESDQGITMSVLTVSPGSIIGVEDFDTDLSVVGYFLKGETCENPFDFDTPLVTDTSIVFGEMNYTSPCIELDEMATLGKLQVGESIQAFVSPSAATITYEWFISDNDRDYSLIRNITGSTLELAPEHFRQYIAVKLTGTGDYTGSLSLPLGRVGLSSQTVDVPPLNMTEAALALIANGIVPIATHEDLFAINSTASHIFAGLLVTAGGVSKSYALIRDIDLSSYTNLTQSFLSSFSGTFDGRGFMISNFKLTTSNANSGFIYQINNATLKNFTLNHASVTSSAMFSALLVARSSGSNSLSNIAIKNSSLTSSCVCSGIDWGVGAIIARALHPGTVTLTNITQEATVTGVRGVGGMIGLLDNKPTIVIESSINTGNVTASSQYAGAAVGYNRSNKPERVIIRFSQNTGIIEVNGSVKVDGINTPVDIFVGNGQGTIE